MEQVGRMAWSFKDKAEYQVFPSPKRILVANNPFRQYKGQSPWSVSHRLYDSPISLLARIMEKVETWSGSYPLS